MNPRHEHADALAEMLQVEREEIERYRWIESEKVGRDIGWARAAAEWKNRHYGDWQRAVLASGSLHPLVASIWNKRAEIEHYKWLASEKAGRDIGWKRAFLEWEQIHYSEGHARVAKLEQLDRPRKTSKKSKRSFSPEHKQNLSAAVEAWWANRKAQSRNTALGSSSN